MYPACLSDVSDDGNYFLKLKREKISASDKNPNMLFLRNEISKIFEEFI